MPENLALRTSDHDRRDIFRSLIARWEEDIEALQPALNEPDTTSFMRAMLEDLIGDARGEVMDLTDSIGDETDYGGKAA